MNECWARLGGQVEATFLVQRIRPDGGVRIAVVGRAQVQRKGSARRADYGGAGETSDVYSLQIGPADDFSAIAAVNKGLSLRPRLLLPGAVFEEAQAEAPAGGEDASERAMIADLPAGDVHKETNTHGSVGKRPKMHSKTKERSAAAARSKPALHTANREKIDSDEDEDEHDDEDEPAREAAPCQSFVSFSSSEEDEDNGGAGGAEEHERVPQSNMIADAGGVDQAAAGARAGPKMKMVKVARSFMENGYLGRRGQGTIVYCSDRARLRDGPGGRGRRPPPRSRPGSGRGKHRRTAGHAGKGPDCARKQTGDAKADEQGHGGQQGRETTGHPPQLL